MSDHPRHRVLRWTRDASQESSCTCILQWATQFFCGQWRSSCLHDFFHSFGPGRYGEMADPDEEEDSTALAITRASRHEAAKTVLPAPVASLISLTTSTSSLSLNLGGFFGQAAINLARFGTLGGLELGRVILEGLLFRAGQDVVQTSRGSHGRAAAEGLLESAVGHCCWKSTDLNSFAKSSQFAALDTP